MSNSTYHRTLFTFMAILDQLSFYECFSLYHDNLRIESRFFSIQISQLINLLQCDTSLDAYKINSACNSYITCILYSFFFSRFYVDDIPIRIFKNKTNIGVNYPSQPMQIEASLWNGDSWATDGGQTKTNWSHAPFKAHFQGFNVGGCPLDQNSINIHRCYSSNYWWNDRKFWKLDKNQQKAYQQVRQKYMNYDYCSDRSRHPNIPPDCV